MIHQLQVEIPATLLKVKGSGSDRPLPPISGLTSLWPHRSTSEFYDLVKQELSKKLMTGSKWISMSIHPGGDNPGRDLRQEGPLVRPGPVQHALHQTLRYHTNAPRAVEYHKRYPLFASAGDDMQTTVSHGMVYSDLQNL